MANRAKFTIELDQVDQDNLHYLLKAWNARSKVAAVAQALSLARLIVTSMAAGAAVTVTRPGGKSERLAFPGLPPAEGHR